MHRCVLLARLRHHALQGDSEREGKDHPSASLVGKNYSVSFFELFHLYRNR